MPRPLTRVATPDDLAGMLRLIDAFASTHKAANHPRPVDVMAEALFGKDTSARWVVAEHEGQLVGYAGWRPVFDYFWAMHGAEAEGLFVLPEYRSFGLGACLIAELCADIRRHDGVYLRATYDAAMAPLYERLGVGYPQRSCHLSAERFELVADLAGEPPRAFVEALRRHSAVVNEAT